MLLFFFFCICMVILIVLFFLFDMCAVRLALDSVVHFPFDTGFQLKFWQKNLMFR